MSKEICRNCKRDTRNVERYAINYCMRCYYKWLDYKASKPKRKSNPITKAKIIAKARQLGASITIDADGITLDAPKGKTFNGMHYSHEEFDGGKQSAYDGIWSDMNEVLLDCDCGCGKEQS